MMKRIKDFVDRYPNIYLYGAGTNAKLLLHFLKEIQIRPKACLVSKQTRETSLCGIPIFVWGEFCIEDDAGVILAVSEYFQKDILKRLSDINVLSFQDSFFNILKAKSFEKFLHNFYIDSVESFNRCQMIGEWRNVLVVRLDAVGDMIWTIPFIRELRNNLSSEAKIMLVHRPNVSTLMEDCPYIDCNIEYDIPLNHWDFDDEIDLIKKEVLCFCEKKLVPCNFDAVILPRAVVFGDNIESILIALYCGAKNRLIRQNLYQSGTDIYQNELKKKFSYIFTSTQIEHEVSCLFGFLQSMGGTIKNRKLELWINKGDDCAQVFDYKNKYYIALGLVSSEKKRTWSIEYYIKLIEQLEKESNGRFVFLLLGGNDAKKLQRKINKNGSVRRCCVDLIGKTSLLQVVSYISKCNLYVGSNTGLYHIAVACGKPVICISPNAESKNPISRERSGPWMIDNSWITPIDKDDDNINHVNVIQVIEEIKKYSGGVL